METPVQRPVLLTVLCVLTIAWSGLSVFISLTQIPTLYVPTSDNPQIQISMERLKELNPEMADGMIAVIEELDKHKMTNWVLSFVGNCFSLMGGLMMWHLQKRGFYIYAAAELIPTTITLFTSGLTNISSLLGPMGPLVETVLAVTVAFVFIIDIVFILLYRMNLKHMT